MMRRSALARGCLLATVLGSGMEFIDGTVVNVALPALQRSLGASGAQVQWVVEAYALFLSALLLVGGALGDRYGLRKIYTIGIVVFAVGFGLVRSRANHRPSDCGACSAGGGWSDAGSQQSCSGKRALSPAEQGSSDWHMVGLCLDDDCAGAGAGRMAGAAWVVALGLLHQRSTGRCNGGDCSLEGA